MIVPSAEQIRQRLDVVKQLAREGRRLTVFNPDHLASWTDIEDLLTLLDTLSQELERLKEENQTLLTRSGKPDADRDFSIHASADGGSL